MIPCEYDKSIRIHTTKELTTCLQLSIQTIMQIHVVQLKVQWSVDAFQFEHTASAEEISQQQVTECFTFKMTSQHDTIPRPSAAHNWNFRLTICRTMCAHFGSMSKPGFRTSQGPRWRRAGAFTPVMRFPVLRLTTATFSSPVKSSSTSLDGSRRGRRFCLCIGA